MTARLAVADEGGGTGEVTSGIRVRSWRRVKVPSISLDAAKIQTARKIWGIYEVFDEINRIKRIGGRQGGVNGIFHALVIPWNSRGALPLETLKNLDALKR